MHASLWIAAIAVALLATNVRANDPEQIERGRYLANDVAKCVECHTPRDGNGNLERSQLFRGAPIPVGTPPFLATSDWALRAPQISGGAVNTIIVPILTTGRRTTGEVPRRPMPTFHMSQEDAEAVAAYLRSLP
ncbi:MAG: cytochrome c [bacterium]|nr:cytochrome c [bacterium]